MLAQLINFIFYKLINPCPKRSTGGILLTLLIASGLLVSACGGKTAIPTPEALPTSTQHVTATLRPTSPPASLSTPTAIPLPEVSPEDLAGTRLRFWHAERGALNDQLEELEARFNATNPWGIWIEATEFNSMQALEGELFHNGVSASSPDVVIAYPEHAVGWNQTGELLVDLQRYIQDPTWGLTLEELGDRQPVVWRAAQAGPAWLGIPASASTHTLFYNLTWGNELGFAEPPRTLEEFKQVACAAAEANLLDPHWVKHGTGGWLVDYEPQTVLSWLAAFGAEIDFTSQATYQFNQPATLEAWTSLRQMYDEGCAWIGRLPDEAG